MEMSRQRLRPALSEGASIPCPRCGGSGHIRDTESSALQILRIIQEESMKDSTASVLCQVPVDVASFLLNEKRSEIAKIEMKQRINVLLVPNKTLETPNYKLERLKHDDPRLDNIEASYKMAEEIEDPTLVTRRSQEKHNKKEPIIKGVLPDMPAPIVAPKPEVAAKPVAAAQQRSPLAARTPAAEKGFFGWLKNLFSGDDAAAAVAPGKDVKKDERGEGRRDERGERGERSERGERGGRDGRRGGRGGRGERTEGRTERTGERGAERGEGRAEPRRERNPEGRAEGRPERAPSESRGDGGREGGRGAERSSEARPDLRAEGQTRSEAQPRGEGRGDRNRRDRPERTDRGERGAERTGAPRDAAQEELALANQAAMAAAARGEVTAPEAGREERQPREVREPREPREGRRERGGRRPERRDDAPAAEGSQTGVFDTNNNGPAVRPERLDMTESTDAATQGNEPAPGQDDTQERAPRERRSRDRYGRERRERGDRAESSPDQAADANTLAISPVQMGSTQSNPATADIAKPVVTVIEVPVAPASVAPTAITVPAPAPVAAPATKALPQVATYDLPLQDLTQVANASGLQWVNSNTSKIAETQAAMAAEPRPAHVPRERAPVVAVQASPLVLVETKRDLRNMTLPFEETASTQRPE